MANSLNSLEQPGALGLGQPTANIILFSWHFSFYLSTLPFAMMADAWLGRYLTLRFSLS